MTRDEANKLADHMEFHYSYHMEFALRDMALAAAENRASFVGDGHYRFPVKMQHGQTADNRRYVEIAVYLPPEITEVRVRTLLAEEQIRREFKKYNIKLPDLSA